MLRSERVKTNFLSFIVVQSSSSLLRERRHLSARNRLALAPKPRPAAAWAGIYQDMNSADRCQHLGRELPVPTPPKGELPSRSVGRFDLRFAVRGREAAIRALRTALRRG